MSALQRIAVLGLAAALLIFPSTLWGQTPSDGPSDEMDERAAVKEFAERAASEEAGVRPPMERRVPLGQKPLVAYHSWRKTTGEIFGLSIAPSYSYWIEGKFGRGGNASYHEQVFGLNIGAETEFTFKVRDWVSGVFHCEYMFHKGSDGVINGMIQEISDFTTISFFLGCRFVFRLRDVFEVERGILTKTNFYFKVLGGAIAMTEVKQVEPKPEMTYWRAGTLWGANLAVGLEFKIDDRLGFFVEHTFDMFSNPDPHGSLRPDNESQPFFFYVVQVGCTFYFD
jgi:hypothetical protein